MQQENCIFPFIEYFVLLRHVPNHSAVLAIQSCFLITFKLSVDDYNNDGDGDDWRAASFSVFLIFQNSGQSSNYPHQWGRKWSIQCAVLTWFFLTYVSNCLRFLRLIGIPQGVCRFGIGWTERKSLTSLHQRPLIWPTESSTESRSIEKEGTCMSR